MKFTIIISILFLFGCSSMSQSELDKLIDHHEDRGEWHRERAAVIGDLPDRPGTAEAIEYEYGEANRNFEEACNLKKSRKSFLELLLVDIFLGVTTDCGSNHESDMNNDIHRFVKS